MIFKIEDENIAEKEIKEKKEKKEKELSERFPEAVESLTVDSISVGGKTYSIGSRPAPESPTISISSIPSDSFCTAGTVGIDSTSGGWVYRAGTTTIPLEDLVTHTETVSTAEEFSKKVVRVIREEAADEAACAAKSRAREALEVATKKEREKYLVKKSEREEKEDKKKLEELDVDGLVAAAVVRGAQLGAARVIQAVSGIIDLKPVSKDLDDIIYTLAKIVCEMNLNGKVKCAPGTGATAYWFDEGEKKEEKKRKTKAKEK